MAQFYDDPFALAGREGDATSRWAASRGTGSSSSGFASAGDQNVSALPDIAQITQLINSINQTAQQASNAGRIPGGRGLEALSSGNIGRALRGEVDPSVINQLAQQSAERGVMTGSPAGAGSQAAYLRALGLNTMDLMNTGQNWLTQATSRNPGAPLFDASSMFITPGQFGSLEMERLRMPRGGGSTGPTGGFPFTGGTASSGGPGMGVNWSDLFGGGGGLTMLGDNFPYGIGTGGSGENLIMSGGGSNPEGFYNPLTDTTDQFNPDYFGAGF